MREKGEDKALRKPNRISRAPRVALQRTRQDCSPSLARSGELREDTEVELVKLGAAKAGKDRVELGVEEAEGVADERDDTAEDRGHSLTSGSKGEADEVVALEKSLGVELEQGTDELRIGRWRGFFGDRTHHSASEIRNVDTSEGVHRAGVSSADGGERGGVSEEWRGQRREGSLLTQSFRPGAPWK